MKNQKGFTTTELFIAIVLLAVSIASASGYVMNIISIAHANFNDMNGMLLLRIIGIVVVPLGAILGYF